MVGEVLRLRVDGIRLERVIILAWKRLRCRWRCNARSGAEIQRCDSDQLVGMYDNTETAAARHDGRQRLEKSGVGLRSAVPAKHRSPDEKLRRNSKESLQREFDCFGDGRVVCDARADAAMIGAVLSKTRAAPLAVVPAHLLDDDGQISAVGQRNIRPALL